MLIIDLYMDGYKGMKGDYGGFLTRYYLGIILRYQGMKRGSWGDPHYSSI